MNVTPVRWLGLVVLSGTLVAASEPSAHPCLGAAADLDVSHAPAVLAGAVYSHAGRPLAGARVTPVGTDTGALSDEDGRFELGGSRPVARSSGWR